jgi:hypothetical protein
MPEVRITKVMPTARVRFTHTWRERLLKFLDVKNAPSLNQWKSRAQKMSESSGMMNRFDHFTAAFSLVPNIKAG